jgi:hypothetical protein
MIPSYPLSHTTPTNPPSPLSDRDDQDCVASQIAAFAAKNSNANVLVCWEHDALTDIAEALGVKKAPDYPGKSYVWFSCFASPLFFFQYFIW